MGTAIHSPASGASSPDAAGYIGYTTIVRAEDPRVPHGAWLLDTDDFPLRATVEEVLEDIKEAVQEEWRLRDQMHVVGLTIIPTTTTER